MVVYNPEGEIDESLSLSMFLSRVNQYSLWRETLIDLYLRGHAYWLVEEAALPRDTESAGQTKSVAEIKRLDPELVVRNIRNSPNDPITYSYNGQTYTADEILEFADPRGNGAIRRLARILTVEDETLNGRAKAAQTIAKHLLLVKSKQLATGWDPQIDLDAMSLAEIQALEVSADEWRAKVEAANNVRATQIDNMRTTVAGALRLGQGDKVIPLGDEVEIDHLVPPTDTYTDESVELVRRFIAVDSGVWAQMLGSPASLTYNNVAEARLGLWQDTVIPELRYLEEQITSWFLMESGYIAKFKLDEVPALVQAKDAYVDIALKWAELADAMVTQMIWTAEEAKQFMENKGVLPN